MIAEFIYYIIGRGWNQSNGSQLQAENMKIRRMVPAPDDKEE